MLDQDPASRRLNARGARIIPNRLNQTIMQRHICCTRQPRDEMTEPRCLQVSTEKRGGAAKQRRRTRLLLRQQHQRATQRDRPEGEQRGPLECPQASPAPRTCLQRSPTRLQLGASQSIEKSHPGTGTPRGRLRLPTMAPDEMSCPVGARPGPPTGWQTQTNSRGQFLKSAQSKLRASSSLATPSTTVCFPTCRTYDHRKQLARYGLPSPNVLLRKVLP